MEPHVHAIKGNKCGSSVSKNNVFTVKGSPAQMYFYQTFNVFIFICFYFKKCLIVCCINLITLNQKIVINTKPNQYSFHSSIQIIKAIVKHLGQADSVNCNNHPRTGLRTIYLRFSKNLSALFNNDKIQDGSALACKM